MFISVLNKPLTGPCYESVSDYPAVLFRTVHRTHTNTDLIKYAATPPNQPQQCILTDYLTITLASSNNTPPDDGD